MKSQGVTVHVEKVLAPRRGEMDVRQQIAQTPGFPQVKRLSQGGQPIYLQPEDQK